MRPSICTAAAQTTSSTSTSMGEGWRPRACRRSSGRPMCRAGRNATSATRRSRRRRRAEEDGKVLRRCHPCGRFLSSMPQAISLVGGRKVPEIAGGGGGGGGGHWGREDTIPLPQSRDERTSASCHLGGRHRSDPHIGSTFDPDESGAHACPHQDLPCCEYGEDKVLKLVHRSHGREHAADRSRLGIPWPQPCHRGGPEFDARMTAGGRAFRRNRAHITTRMLHKGVRWNRWKTLVRTVLTYALWG